MIDAEDRGTQPLDLGDATKRRGRPSTGNAMTNAERQKAYRERQKKRLEAFPEIGLSGALSLWEKTARNLGAANDRIRELEALLASRNEDLQMALDQHRKAVERGDRLQEKLAQRNGKGLKP